MFTTGSDPSHNLLIMSVRLAFWEVFLESVFLMDRRILLQPSIPASSKFPRPFPLLCWMSSYECAKILWTVGVILIHGPGRCWCINRGNWMSMNTLVSIQYCLYYSILTLHFDDNMRTIMDKRWPSVSILPLGISGTYQLSTSWRLDHEEVFGSCYQSLLNLLGL